MGYPTMDGLEWKILLKWMIWGYLYFRKPPYLSFYTNLYNMMMSEYFSASESIQNSYEIYLVLYISNRSKWVSGIGKHDNVNLPVVYQTRSRSLSV